eukprot:GFUD01077302.1.p1 GENE.GFUD01077302.1~~GFUD01077302.1.p1  ORF type:complete len:119 (+),score=16.24 GFUD01077302.1:93-449(+)
MSLYRFISREEITLPAVDLTEKIRLETYSNRNSHSDNCWIPILSTYFVEIGLFDLSISPEIGNAKFTIFKVSKIPSLSSISSTNNGQTHQAHHCLLRPLVKCLYPNILTLEIVISLEC